MVYEASPMSNLKGYFTPEEIELILNNCNNKKAWLLFLILSRTGRRITEIVRSLKPKHIHLEDGMVEFNIKKRKKETWKLIPMEKETLKELMDYIRGEKIEDDEFVFTMSRQRSNQILKKICDRLKIEPRGDTKYNKPHVHWFRHSFAIQAAKRLNRPSDLGTLQNLLAHARIDNTMWYANTFNPKEERKLLEEMWE